MQDSWKKEPSDGWFDPHTLTILAALSATGAVILSMVASGGTGLYRGDELTFGGYVTISLFGLFALMAQLLRLEAVWIRYAGALRKPPRERSASEKQRVEHGFIEFFVYLAAGLMGLSYVAYAASDDGRLGQLPVRLSGAGWNVSHLTLYLLMFGAAFLPLIIGFARHAKLEARQRSDGQDARLLRDDVVSELSFWASFLLVAGLVALAWAAAGGKFQMKEDFGVFITFVVLLVFFVIILAPHVMRFLNEFREKRTIDRTTIKMAGLPALQPGVWTSRLDSILVRLVAPLSGATQLGPVWFIPHLLVLIVILPLSAMGFVLAPPWGLVPIGFAVLIAVALGRRWAWVEEDRETASRLKTTKGGDIHVGFANDLKDEALLGYASLFILVPLALHQIQGWTNAFVVVDEWSSDNAFVDWLRFFGAELAKAVPFVDWWEIYNVDIETPFDAAASENPLAKHLTFAARAMVDLVIMAALFQAIALWQRARTQSRYYDSGQFDSFDPFTEKIFFENGMIKDVRSGKRRPKKKFEERVNAHVVRRRKLGFSPTPYDARRLSELMNSPVADVREGANWMIAKYKVLAGTPAEQLRQLVDQFNSDKFRLALEREDEKGQFYIRDRKAELERVLLELERRPGAFRREQVKDLIKILIIVRDLPEFTPAEVTAVRLFRSQLSRVSRLALYNLVLEDEHRVSATGKDLQTEIATEFGADSELYAGLAPMRVDVFAAIEFHGLQERDDKEKQSIARFLRWMSATSSGEFCVRGDRAKLSRDRAATAARRVELSRRWPLKNKIS